MFWDLIWKFVLISTAICYIALGMYVTLRIQRDIVVRIRRYHGRKLVAHCEKLGAQLYYNELGKTMAVCRVDDYQVTALHDEGPFWQTPTHVWVRPTFAFLSDGGRRSKMHVNATKDQVRIIIDDLVTERTGYVRSAVDKASFDKATHLLIRRNDQLFVPFGFDLPQEEGKRQADFYGSAPSLSDVRHYLLKQ